MYKMLTRNDSRKLGLQVIDLSEESAKIDIFANNLNDRISNLNSKLPVIVPPPIDTLSPGTPGSIAVDEESLYICTKANFWKRINLDEL